MQKQNDENVLMDYSSSTMMEQKQVQDFLVQGVQVPLKCPRCDSSNTKFCYYNNYSLSQPRHLCKACKRYWTRGGTLRSVPVGGGCRKNRRVKRVSQENSSVLSAQVNPRNPSVQTSQIDDVSFSPAKSHINNALLYGLLASNPSELNLPCSIRNGYDYSTFPRFHDGGLGFDPVTSQNLELDDAIMGPGSSNPFLSSYPMYGTRVEQQKFVSSNFKDVAQVPSRFLGFNDVRMPRNGEDYLFGKDVKMEGYANRLDWNTGTNSNYVDQNNSSLWNSSTPGVWLDSSNV